jgi:glycosyltransferase involved in cell wall biosynthesis
LNVWGSDVFEFPDTSPLHRALLLRNLRHADRLVSTSHFMARRTAGLGKGLPPITVVPFGVDTTHFTPAERRQDGHVVVGTVKTLAPKYGIDVLIKAIAHVAGQEPNVRLRIIGDGPQRHELAGLAARLGISEKVEFAGAVPHAAVCGALQGLDVFAALSQADSESFGVAVIEASACGLPVVVSDAGGLPEVVLDGQTGHVVPRKEAQVAAERILELVRSPEKRKAMGMAGRGHVEANYAWPSCVDLQLNVLEQAAISRS